jgi:hypothetical protein
MSTVNDCATGQLDRFGSLEYPGIENRFLSTGLVVKMAATTTSVVVIRHPGLEIGRIFPLRISFLNIKKVTNVRMGPRKSLFTPFQIRCRRIVHQLSTKKTVHTHISRSTRFETTGSSSNMWSCLLYSTSRSTECTMYTKYR